MNLIKSLKDIKGVGSKAYESFLAAGLRTVDDLINFLPRTYEDYSNLAKITELKPGKVTIKAKCEKISTSRVRRGLSVTKAVLFDGSDKIKAVWFNQAYREKQLKNGDEFFFSGKFEYNYNQYQLTSPSAELARDVTVNTDRILPVYRVIKGLKSNLVRKIITEIRPLIKILSETLPDEIIKSEKFISYAQAIEYIHFPNSMEDVRLAKDRLGFEEVFQLLLASQLNRQENMKLFGYKIPFDKKLISNFVCKLPFKLTDSQRIAVWEIIQDFGKSIPMNRLLQGDVGSGKTVVAGLAAYQAAISGFQTAIMAPTEILASQHYATLKNLFKNFDIEVALVTGSIKGKKRQEIYEKIKNGQVDIVIGTQALIQKQVNFHKLALAIIDEQHRFGVEQRQALLNKSKIMPHMLAMSATPIPRSLALTLYGELDISVLTQMPAGRRPIETKIISPNSRESMYKKIDAEIESGRQAYVICNLIDNNPDNDVKSVKSEYDKLRSTIFKHRKIGLLHGKLKPDEKYHVMSNFEHGLIDILISTTVVEVGVNVPNATAIIIENADQFGLAQLHQLRGRVGRSEFQSYCYLVNSTSNKPSLRLQALEKSNDGFYLAEVDLNMRGPGEIYGKAQHGALNLKIATLTDTITISKAQYWAKKFVQDNQNLLQYNQLAQKVQYYQRLTTLS